jgi:hypothetical protein
MSSANNNRPTILIGSESLGTGEIDDVGRVWLIELLIGLNQGELSPSECEAYRITGERRLPEAIVLYNSAVRLATKDSPVVDQLQALEEKGVSIFIDSVSYDGYLGDEAVQLLSGEIVDTYIIQSMLLYKDHVISF